MKKELFKRILFGIYIGTFIGLNMAIIFSYLSNTGQFYPAPVMFVNKFSNSLNATTASVILWSLIGIIFSTSSMIFEYTDWSITKMTIVHFCITYLGFTPLSIICGWVIPRLMPIVFFTIIFIFIYIIIWIIFMKKAKEDINIINKHIN